MPEMLDTDQAASLLGTSKRTLEMYRHEKRGPAYAIICGRARYRIADIERWIDDQFAAYAR